MQDTLEILSSCGLAGFHVHLGKQSCSSEGLWQGPRKGWGHMPPASPSPPFASPGPNTSSQKQVLTSHPPKDCILLTREQRMSGFWEDLDGPFCPSRGSDLHLPWCMKALLF